MTPPLCYCLTLLTRLRAVVDSLPGWPSNWLTWVSASHQYFPSNYCQTPEWLWQTRGWQLYCYLMRGFCTILERGASSSEVGFFQPHVNRYLVKGSEYSDNEGSANEGSAPDFRNLAKAWSPWHCEWEKGSCTWGVPWMDGCWPWSPR